MAWEAFLFLLIDANTHSLEKRVAMVEHQAIMTCEDIKTVMSQLQETQLNFAALSLTSSQIKTDRETIGKTMATNSKLKRGRRS